MRSENATGRIVRGCRRPRPKEVLALAAYISWLSKGTAVGTNPDVARHRTPSRPDKLIPVDRLDVPAAKRSSRNAARRATAQTARACQIGDKKAGPLWGDGIVE